MPLGAVRSASISFVSNRPSDAVSPTTSLEEAGVGEAARAQGKGGSLAEVARAIGLSLSSPEALRLAADWYTRARRLAGDALVGLIEKRPPSTGDLRWDALLAGLVEQLALMRRVPCPGWAFTLELFLGEWWFLSPYPSVHPSALVEAPASLANRGVFVHAADLESL